MWLLLCGALHIISCSEAGALCVRSEWRDVSLRGSERAATQKRCWGRGEREQKRVDDGERERENSWEMIRWRRRERNLLIGSQFAYVCVCVCVCVCLPTTSYVSALFMYVYGRGVVILQACHPPRPPHIHTHPTSLTAICPVINLRNIYCLAALHQIIVCACVFVRACEHLSTCLSFCWPALTCVCLLGRDPNGWVCSLYVTKWARVYCCDAIWYREKEREREKKKRCRTATAS